MIPCTLPENCRAGKVLRSDQIGAESILPCSIFCNQVRLSEGFDLHIADRSKIEASSSKSKFDPAISGTKADNVLGIIHKS